MHLSQLTAGSQKRRYGSNLKKSLNSVRNYGDTLYFGLIMDKIMNPEDVSRGVERCPIPLENPADVTDVLDFVVSCLSDVLEDSFFFLLSVVDTVLPRRGGGGVPIPEVGASSYYLAIFLPKIA